MSPLTSRIPRFRQLLFFLLGSAVAVSCLFLPVLPNAIGRYLPNILTPYTLFTLGHNFPGALVLAWIQGIAYGPLAALAIALGARLCFGRRLRFLSFAAGLATPLILLFAAARYGPSIQEYWHRQPFDASAWRSAREDCSSFWTTRITMMHSLIEAEQLPGKTRSEIEALLGPSDDFAQIELKGGPNFQKTDWDLGYCLGAPRWSHPYFVTWLLVKIGPDGRVQNISFARDDSIP